MSDVTQGQDEAQASPAGTIIHVPITKGGKGVTLEVNTADIPDDVYNEIVLQGLKVLMNRGMSKITKASTKNAEEMATLAMEAGAKNLELIKTSKIKFTGGKAKGLSGAVKTEAMRLARNVVKAEMKKAGLKISHVEASEITKAAKTLLEQDQSLIEQAQANLAEREKVPVATSIISAIKTSPKKVAAAEAKKAKDQLSAKQAGKTKTRAKGQQAQA